MAAVNAMNTPKSPVTRFVAWAILVLCAAYLIVPLLAQFDYSLRMRRNTLSFDAYAKVLEAPEGSFASTADHAGARKSNCRAFIRRWRFRCWPACSPSPSARW